MLGEEMRQAFPFGELQRRSLQLFLCKEVSISPAHGEVLAEMQQMDLVNYFLAVDNSTISIDETVLFKELIG